MTGYCLMAPNSSIDIVQLDAGRWLEVVRLNLLLALSQLLGLFKPCGRLLRLKVVCWPREHFRHEKRLDTSAILFDGLAYCLYTNTQSVRSPFRR